MSGRSRRNTRTSLSDDITSSTGTFHCTSNIERNACEQRIQKVLPTEVIVMRHSERVDDLFPRWTKKSIHEGKYTPYDLNMPKSLPINRPIDHYLYDTPITSNGTIIAGMIGRGLSVTKRTPDIIYCSPLLRCIQTAYNVKVMSGSQASIRVEPALMENPYLYPSMPHTAGKKEREQFGVDETYQPLCRVKDLFKKEESIKAYNRRLRDVLLRIASTTESPVTPRKPLVVLVRPFSYRIPLQYLYLLSYRTSLHLP